MTHTYTETLEFGRAVWQSSPDAKTYRCPHCSRNLFTQFTGDEVPSVQCAGSMGPHVLTWRVERVAQAGA